MELKNVSRYYPEETPYGEGFQYFMSEDGQDFYESLDSFTRKYKLCIEPGTAIVRSFDEDASRLYPAGYDVVETDSLPDDIDVDGDWQFIDGEVVPRVYTAEELIAQATARKAVLLVEASDAIAPLQDAADLGMVTDDEQAQLLAWKQYRVKLNRIEPGDAPDIDWPTPPAT